MLEFGTFKDERDGHVYKTVRIGNQTWLAENFRLDCAGSMVYENESENLRKHGRLYDWRSAMNAAPDGWRLPSMEDWDELIGFAGGDARACEALKAKAGWRDSGSANGTDEFGFGALPGGIGTPSRFSIMSGQGRYWSATEDDYGGGAYFWTFGEEASLDYSSDLCSYKLSVRFVES